MSRSAMVLGGAAVALIAAVGWITMTVRDDARGVSATPERRDRATAPPLPMAATPALAPIADAPRPAIEDAASLETLTERLEEWAVIRQLRKTGPSKAPWTDRARALLDLVQHASTVDGDGRYAIQAGIGCYAGGCYGSFGAEARAELVRARDHVEASDEWRAWKGRTEWSDIQTRTDLAFHHVWVILYPPEP